MHLLSFCKQFAIRRREAVLAQGQRRPWPDRALGQRIVMGPRVRVY